MKSKGKIEPTQEEKFLLKWLTYTLIAAMVFWLLSLPFKKGLPVRQNFPTHTPPVPKR